MGRDTHVYAHIKGVSYIWVETHMCTHIKGGKHTDSRTYRKKGKIHMGRHTLAYAHKKKDKTHLKMKK